MRHFQGTDSMKLTICTTFTTILHLLVSTTGSLVDMMKSCSLLYHFSTRNKFRSKKRLRLNRSPTLMTVFQWWWCFRCCRCKGWKFRPIFCEQKGGRVKSRKVRTSSSCFKNQSLVSRLSFVSYESQQKSSLALYVLYSQTAACSVGG